MTGVQGPDPAGPGQGRGQATLQRRHGWRPWLLEGPSEQTARYPGPHGTPSPEHKGAVFLKGFREAIRWAMIGFGAITADFAYTLVTNVIEQPDGIKIASLFIVATHIPDGRPVLFLGSSSRTPPTSPPRWPCTATRSTEYAGCAWRARWRPTPSRPS
jgi:hypothetical protein